MSSSTMSLLGLYTFNPLVVSELVLPEGVDRTTLVDNLLAETAELELIYSDLGFMQAMIGRWSTKEAPIWKKLLATTQFEYNPIENYDRREDWTDTTTGSTQSNGTNTQNSSSSFSGETEGKETLSSNQENINSVSAYNSLEFANKDKADTELTQNTNAEQNSSSKTSQQSSGNTTNTEERQNEIVRSGRAHGNIGVTSSQQLIEEERRVAQFNIYDYIINSFKNRFCLLVY